MHLTALGFTVYLVDLVRTNLAAMSRVVLGIPGIRGYKWDALAAANDISDPPPFPHRAPAREHCVAVDQSARAFGPVQLWIAPSFRRTVLQAHYHPNITQLLGRRGYANIGVTQVTLMA